MDECVECKTPRVSTRYGEIWLSNDGYCSVCNVKYRDRPRMKPIFEFKTIKEGEYNHLNMHGKGHTNNSFLRDNIKMKTKSTVSNYIIGTILESKKRRIDEWI